MTGLPGVAPAALIVDHDLPEQYLDIVEHYWRPLAHRIAEVRATLSRPIIIGVNGAQGSGKSTLCDFLARSLLPEIGLSAATLSLDDLYLSRAARERLARDVHPLFATRGVPGTHDVELGRVILDRVISGQPGEIRLPRFDKRNDDCAPIKAWPRLALPIDVFLFEGWCIGAQPRGDAALVEPINALERDEDSAGIWRRHVNRALAGAYQALFERIDLLVMLQPPSFEAVAANRALQERKLAASGAKGRTMDAAALHRFMLHYERLTRHMFAEMPARADVLFHLDDNQRPIGMTQRATTAGH
ncbi:kinase [Sphingomonas oligophenolica]|uniref:Kinase n=1 Tax=Sphingomonas oligophenolica TaxID=301154 RepID=A0ABU9XYX0_9SPHN